MIILDTNVLSEMLRLAPAREVLTRIRGFRTEELYTTAITEAELRRGLEITPPGRNLDERRLAMESILTRFGGRILSFDSVAAKFYATLVASRQRVGRPISGFDAQIAGIVRTHQATLVTRNTRDFEGCGFEVINPWK